MMMNKKYSFIWGLFQLMVSIGLIAFIIPRINLKEIVTSLRSLRGDFLIISLALLIIVNLLSTYRWYFLLKAKGMKLSFFKLLRIMFETQFLGRFLPSRAGDALRIAYLSKTSTGFINSASSLFLDRILGLSALLLVAFIGFVLGKGSLTVNRYFMWPLTGIIALILTFVFFMSSGRILRGLEKRYISLRKFFLWKGIKRIHDAFYEYRDFKLILCMGFLLAICFQVLMVVTSFVIASSLNVHLPFIYFLIYIPWILVATSFPISIGGIGVREIGFVYFFSSVGLSASSAVNLSLTIYALTFIAALPGVVSLIYRNIQNIQPYIIKNEKVSGIT